MLFNIFTANHGDAAAVASISPLIDYARYTLSRCGYPVIVDSQKLYKGAINLFFEYFDTRESVDNLIAFKKETGIVVGVIATELIVGGQIPYGQHVYTGIDEVSVALRNRIDNFNRLAPFLDFIWCFLDGRGVSRPLSDRGALHGRSRREHPR